MTTQHTLIENLVVATDYLDEAFMFDDELDEGERNSLLHAYYNIKAVTHRLNLKKEATS